MALANATQERLELENKLMVLEAKKEQMDTLLRELQSLKEAQLRKGTFVFQFTLRFLCFWQMYIIAVAYSSQGTEATNQPN